MLAIIDRIYFLIRNGKRLELKLASYQGFKKNIIEWKRQTRLPWSIIFKMLDEFEVYTSPKIRDIIRQVVTDHESIFSRENCFITGFGNTGKSGDIILYEFSHTTNINQTKVKKTWQLNSLPSGSTIIFVEDIIGTGNQSVEYIQDRLNQVLNPSHQPFLLSLCATRQGIENLTNNTHFQVLPGVILEEIHQYYSTNSLLFSSQEKEKILEINGKLKRPGAFDFDLGLLLAFYFTIPNNAMPIFWKDNYRYLDANGQESTWNALLPRQY